MPIWADFMREALNLHPEWNGDWQMPGSVRKAEIDTRNGKLIRELSDAEAETVKAQQKVLKNNVNADTNSQIPSDTTAENKEIYVTEVPPEFRRVELFISGTVPNKTLLPTDEATLTEGETAEPDASATPFVTWQEAQKNPTSNQNSSVNNEDSIPEFQKNITVMICPLTGMRATSNCPNKKPQTFNDGEEPKDFCTFHVNPPK
jgi:hypothetical protein